MLNTSRSISLLLLAALLATVLLGLGLPRLHFAPGVPLPLVNKQAVMLEAANASTLVVVQINKVVGVIAAAGLVILCGYALWRC